MSRIVLPLYLAFVLMMADRAHAYLDPGNGSMVLQIILGGAAGIGVLLKYYWHQVTGLFRSKKELPKEDN